MNYKNLYFMLFNGISKVIDEKENGDVYQKLRQLQVDAEEMYIEYPYSIPKAVGSYSVYLKEDESIFDY